MSKLEIGKRYTFTTEFFHGNIVSTGTFIGVMFDCYDDDYYRVQKDDGTIDVISPVGTTFVEA